MEILKRPAEVVFLGKHRQRRRAAALVGLHHVGHGRALADHAGGGRAALVLGHQRRAGVRERLAERAALATLGHLPLEFGQRSLALAPLHALARGVDQLFEAHRHQVRASSLVRFT